MTKELENPFTPSFGEVPAHVAGRHQIISDVTNALKKQGRSPELTCLFSGARGTGKTTLLQYLSEKAESMGWVCANATALPGMLDDLEISICQNASHLISKSSGKHISGIEVAGLGGISFSDSDKAKSNWRSRISSVLDALAQHETGLMITVDEINPGLDELIELVATYQHFVREGKKVSLLMAGLPGKISSIQNDKTVSFLRRAQGFTLGKIDDFDVEDALCKTISENKREAEAKGIDIAVKAISGFPFLLQLVGYRSWDVNPTSKVITAKDFEKGINAAKRELKARVLEATYLELSNRDIEFLKAMTRDSKENGEVRISDLVSRLGWSDSQVAQYRKRMIDAGVIGYRGRGVVAFDLPFFKEYIEEV